MSPAAPAGREQRAERTVMDVLRLSTEYLADHRSASPRLDAELLLAHALRVRRIDLYLMHDRPLRDDELTAARRLVRRRAGHEPVAYITGTREFYGRAFAVTPAVLIPRPETETIIEVALTTLRHSRDTVVADLGTGSGAIAVTLAAEVPELHVIAVDISAGALEVAGRNAVAHGVEDRVTLAEGDWGGPLTSPVAMVVSNPPYVSTDELAATEPDVRDFEPEVALDGGRDGMDAYHALLDGLPGRLRGG
ncbi:MAG TPA: peptide chain release factor N(5)-glutamine methyltransferase, partial [Candidatus Dormibacteraeota bacterium]